MPTCNTEYCPVLTPSIKTGSNKEVYTLKQSLSSYLTGRILEERSGSREGCFLCPCRCRGATQKEKRQSMYTNTINTQHTRFRIHGNKHQIQILSLRPQKCFELLSVCFRMLHCILTLPFQRLTHNLAASSQQLHSPHCTSTMKLSTLV